MEDGKKMIRTTPQSARPWFREPWPWLLISGPALTVAAGLATLWLAVASDDGLVADDYYKRGLAINRVLTREAVARSHHYRAHVVLNPARDRVRVTLAGDGMPRALELRILHPTRAGLDRLLTLPAAGGGVYEARIAPLPAGHWRLVVEDERATWRLAGEWRAPGPPVARLSAN